MEYSSIHWKQGMRLRSGAEHRDFHDTFLKGLFGEAVCDLYLDHCKFRWSGCWEEYSPQVPPPTKPGPDFVYTKNGRVFLAEATAGAVPQSDIIRRTKGKFKLQVLPYNERGISANGFATGLHLSTTEAASLVVTLDSLERKFAPGTTPPTFLEHYNSVASQLMGGHDYYAAQMQRTLELPTARFDGRDWLIGKAIRLGEAAAGRFLFDKRLAEQILSSRSEDGSEAPINDILKRQDSLIERFWSNPETDPVEGFRDIAPYSDGTIFGITS
jgi:hypothetical protein